MLLICKTLKKLGKVYQNKAVVTGQKQKSWRTFQRLPALNGAKPPWRATIRPNHLLGSIEIILYGLGPIPRGFMSEFKPKQGSIPDVTNDAIDCIANGRKCFESSQIP